MEQSLRGTESGEDSAMSENNNLKKVCGLWLNTSKSTGTKYFSGRLDTDSHRALSPDSKIFIFRNDKKRTENSPDYFLFVEEKPPEPEPQAGDSDMPF